MASSSRTLFSPPPPSNCCGRAGFCHGRRLCRKCSIMRSGVLTLLTHLSSRHSRGGNPPIPDINYYELSGGSDHRPLRQTRSRSVVLHSPYHPLCPARVHHAVCCQTVSTSAPRSGSLHASVMCLQACANFAASHTRSAANRRSWTRAVALRLAAAAVQSAIGQGSGQRRPRTRPCQ